MPCQTEEYKLSWKVVSVKRQGKTGLGRRHCQTAVQIWQSLCQPNWEPQSRELAFETSPVERECQGTSRTFWLSHLLRPLCGEDDSSSSWDGPESLSRWFSHLGNESFKGELSCPCLHCLPQMVRATQSLAKSRNERLDLCRDVFILGFHMELGNQ